MNRAWPSGQPEPSRIVAAELAVMPSGDVAELVTDSLGDIWAHWFSKGPGTWSDWRRVAQKAAAAAIDGPFGTGGEAALITVISGRGEPPLARSWFLIAAGGFTTFSM